MPRLLILRERTPAGERMALGQKSSAEGLNRVDVAIKEAMRQGKINTALWMRRGSRQTSAALADEEKRQAGT